MPSANGWPTISADRPATTDVKRPGLQRTPTKNPALLLVALSDLGVSLNPRMVHGVGYAIHRKPPNVWLVLRAPLVGLPIAFVVAEGLDGVLICIDLEDGRLHLLIDRFI